MAKLSWFPQGSSPTIYTEGSSEELQHLFRGFVPTLPPGGLSEGGETLYTIQHHPQLKLLAHENLTRIFLEIAPATVRRELPPVSEKTGEKYSELLKSILVNSLRQDRRIGLVNLFWLSHSKEIAAGVSELAARHHELGALRFAIHPYLSRFLVDVWETARGEAEPSKSDPLQWTPYLPGRFSVVDTLIDDQLPLVLSRVDEIDFPKILENNRRYRIPWSVFSEIYDVLLREIERRISGKDRLFTSKLARHLPSMEPQSYTLEAQQIKMLFNSDVRRFLLIDPQRIGARLMASERFRAESARSDPLLLLEAFESLLSAVQRFEILSRLRERILLLPSVMSEAQIQESYSKLRIYRFSESVEVMGNAVTATVLFLDLRGFTKTSEGPVSERDLTRELYTVFDPFIEIIARFGGEVDKYLGDGMMVTFGAVSAAPQGPLDALRAAILLQEKIRQLREEGKTNFTMGVSIHHGRVYLAHFMESSGGQDTTVIGRNVNLAGRLSSASKRERADEDENLPEVVDRLFAGLETETSLSEIQVESHVEVDAEGTLFNQGIAVSRETVQALEQITPLTRRDEVEDLYGELEDTTINKKVWIRYVGEAKFKGVWGSLPVYSVEYT